MPDTTKVHRCLQLLRALQARGALTTAEAARLLGVDREAARRDLAAVAGAVPDLRVEGEGRGRRWRLGRPAGLAVGFGEQLALHFGRQLMSFLAGTLLPDWLDELTEKIGSGVSDDAGARADKLARRFLYVTEPYRPYEAHDDTIDALFRALLDDREAEIAYAEGRAYPRFQPYTLVVYRRALYLIGHVPGVPGLHTLAVDRIRAVRVTERTFRLPADYAPAAVLRDFVGIRRHPPPEPVRLRFPGEKRRYVEARRWHPSAVVRDGPDGTVELELHAGGEELVNLALEWGAACEVIEPAWLRAKVIAEMEAALRGYGRGPLSDPSEPVRPKG